MVSKVLKKIALVEKELRKIVIVLKLLTRFRKYLEGL